MSEKHNYEDLIRIFDHCFLKSYNTRLIKGGEEPIYLPTNDNRPHNELYFARGFFASALHETSHWLIAGEKRRQLVDFGYWYEPEGRSAEQQVLFQSVEVKPQAMEWILSKAAGYRFQVSVDNFDHPNMDVEGFKKSIYQQVKHYCEQGLSTRATSIRQALCAFYETPIDLNFKDFDLESL